MLLRSLLVAFALLMSATISNAQQLTRICVGTVGSSCVPVDGTNPMPVTGTFTSGSATGSAVPSGAFYNGINVAGTLRGWTGVNPSGSIFAGQIDLASVAGATVVTGNGTAAGSIRVSLPTDGTGVVGLNAAASGVAIGNVGALTKVVCVAPTVTSATYGANVVIGGLLQFTNIFTAAHSGTIQAIALNFTTAQTVGFLFYPFATSPTAASTWTDHSTAAISGSTDIFSTRNPTPLANATSNLGAGTNYGAVGIGQAMVSTDANLYGILIPTATTASLAGTANVVQICVKVLQDN